MSPHLLTTLQRALGTAYRVERELGGGGMSRVFVAEEVALGRRVAVKVLVADAMSELSTDRFRLEMQVAAGLQHRAIVPVLSTGSAEGVTWFTMPFVAGETLRARLTRDGALPVADVVRFARDLFEALAAAHAAGIVHRDIKPENLLISGRHLAVADFGVARALSRSTNAGEGAARLTGVGLAIGTPAYMAPEQALADDSADHRVDLYAAGLVLYEMLHGASPFLASTPAAIIAAHISTEPPDLRLLRPDAPASLLALTMQCLAKSPTARPASATEALDVLDRASEAPGPVGGDRVTRGGISRRTRALIGVACVASVGAIGVRAWLGARAPAVRGPKDLIVVGDFLHAPADSSLARALVQALRTDVGASGALRVPDLTRIRATLRTMQQPDSATLDAALLGDLARRLGAKARLEGRVDRVGAGFVFTARLVATGDDATLASLRESARDSTGILDAIDRLARAVRQSAGESVNMLATRTPLPLYTTRSLAALERVGEGQRLIQAGRSSDAVDAFRAAVRLDSNFASAWRGVAVSLGNVGIRPGERFDALKRAYALRERLPEAERLAIEGTWYAFVDEQEAAAASWRALAAADPEGSTAPNNLSIALQMLGRQKEARDVIRAAMPLAPGSVTFRANLQNTSLELGDTTVVDSIAGLPGARLDERMDAMAMKRRYVDIYAMSDSVLRNPHTPIQATTATFGKGQSAVVLGRMRVAMQLVETALSESDKLDAAQLAQDAAPPIAAMLLEYTGDTARAVQYMDDMLLRFPLASLDPVARNYANLAAGYAGLGRADRALTLLAERARVRPRETMRRDSANVLLAQSLIAISRGEYAKALQLTQAGESESAECRSWCTAATLARIHDRMGNADATLREIDRYLQIAGAFRVNADQYDLAWTLKRSGELLETRGETVKAIARYRELVTLWEKADAELQPIVRDLKERIARLESRRG